MCITISRYWAHTKPTQHNTQNPHVFSFRIRLVRRAFVLLCRSQPPIPSAGGDPPNSGGMNLPQSQPHTSKRLLHDLQLLYLMRSPVNASSNALSVSGGIAELVSKPVDRKSAVHVESTMPAFRYLIRILNRRQVSGVSGSASDSIRVCFWPGGYERCRRRASTAKYMQGTQSWEGGAFPNFVKGVSSEAKVKGLGAVQSMSNFHQP